MRRRENAAEPATEDGGEDRSSRFPGGRVPLVVHEIRRRADQREQLSIEFRLERADGDRLAVLAGVAAIERSGAAEKIAGGDLSPRVPIEGPGEVGQLERSFNAMADSLARQRAELEERNQRLVESERLKTDLVSNVSHELRTPLSSLLGFSDLMLKRDVAPEDRRRYLGVIRAESARLATLLNDLLDLQRQELGVLELRLTEFDLNELLDVQVTLYSAQSSVHELVLTPSPEPVIIRVGA